MGDDPPADPAPEAIRAVVAAAIQPVVALEHVNPPLGPSTKAEAAAEPALPLVLLPLFGQAPHLRQDDVLDTPVARAGFVLRGGGSALT